MVQNDTLRLAFAIALGTVVAVVIGDILRKRGL